MIPLSVATNSFITAIRILDLYVLRKLLPPFYFLFFGNLVRVYVTWCYFIVWLLISDIISSLPKQLFTQYMKVSTRSFKHCVPFRHAGGYIEIMVMHVGYMRCLHFPMTSLLLTISLYKFNIIPFLMGSGVITLNYGRIPVDLVQPETSLSLSFFGT